MAQKVPFSYLAPDQPTVLKSAVMVIPFGADGWAPCFSVAVAEL